jgi:hypothetical protein
LVFHHCLSGWGWAVVAGWAGVVAWDWVGGWVVGGEWDVGWDKTLDLECGDSGACMLSEWISTSVHRRPWTNLRPTCPGRMTRQEREPASHEVAGRRSPSCDRTDVPAAESAWTSARSARFESNNNTRLWTLRDARPAQPASQNVPMKLPSSSSTSSDRPGANGGRCCDRLMEERSGSRGCQG